MRPTASVLISSHNRSGLFRRCLWSVANRPPKVPFEVVVADDGSDEDVPSVLREFSAAFPWKFVRASVPELEAASGVKRFFNNPSWTNNLAYRHSSGDVVYLMGNEVIAWGGVFEMLRLEIEEGRADLAFSTTYDVGPEWLDRLDRYGSNLTPHLVRQCQARPLQSEDYRSDVTNYLSACRRSLWGRLGGYDERYVAGIAAEDSDFVRRARAAGARAAVVPDAVSLHQFHSGKTRYYDPPPSVITGERWAEGLRINHATYHGWDGKADNPQPWPWGTFGVLEVIDNA